MVSCNVSNGAPESSSWPAGSSETAASPCFRPMRLPASVIGVPPKRSRPHAAETFVAVWIPRDPRNPAEHWLVDLAAGTVSFTGREAQEDSDWDIVGSADAWDQVLSGDLNLSVALRACQLRYCDGDESRPLAGEARVAMLGFLLGLTDW